MTSHPGGGAARRPRRAWPLGVALLLCALAAGLATRLVTLRTDLADFIPTGGSEAARLMVREIASGEAAGLVVIGLDSAPASDLATLSRRLAEQLRRSGLFETVQNGEGGLEALLDGELFAARYLLSGETSAAAFETPALRASFGRLLEQLQSSASPIVGQIGFADPTGAFLSILKTWGGASRVRLEDGVWFDPERDRALLLAKLPRSGMGAAGQAAALAFVDTAFAAAKAGASEQAGGAALRMTGPAVFARNAARDVRADVEFLSVLSTVFIAALLLWRFRSPWVLAVIAIPVVLSIAAASLAVQLAFGFVHGIAFGFGMTMLGVSVDYPVLLVGHRKTGEASPATLRRIGPAFRLAVAGVVVGLSGLAASGFPGLVQVGVFAAVGLLVAALVTWFVLPPLIVAIDLAPVPSPHDGRLLRVERLRDWRLATLALPGLAVAVLLARPPRWEDDLRNLSPIPPTARALDAELRGAIGAPDAGFVLLVAGPDVEQVLRREEALAPRLETLRRDGVLLGAEYAARLLPSAETQRVRQAALPPRDELSSRVAAATAGSAFRDGAFARFVADVDANRTMAPVTLETLRDSALALRVRPTLFAQDGRHYGVIVPQGVSDRGRLRAALASEPDVLVLDVRQELDAVVTDTTRRALGWLTAGALLVLLVLAAGLREPARVARVAGATLAAGLCSLAALSLAGLTLSMITIVSGQLALGVGLDYALFFARPRLDEEERARTLRTLSICAAMTLVTFGLLASCRTPILRDMGLTVVFGVTFSMIFAFQFAGERPATGGRERPGEA